MISAPPISFATAFACARARGLPRVPSRSGGSVIAASAAFVATAPLVEVGDVGALRGPGLRARVEAEELAQGADLYVRILAVGDSLDPDRGLVEEAVGDRARHLLDPLAIGGGEALPAGGVLGEHLRDDRIGPLAQSRDRRHHLLGAQPLLEPSQLGVEDPARTAGLRLPAGGILLD